jgi:RNA polymerase sigma-70 factor (ECF subfamily)
MSSHPADDGQPFVATSEFRDGLPEPRGDDSGVHAGFAEALSFDDFYRAEVRGLVALARGLASAAVAEDIAQEAMLVALRRWQELAQLDHPEAWVRRTCANLAVSSFRRRLTELKALGRVRSTPARELDSPADDGFWTLVRGLPRRQAQAVALHYLYDLSVAEVAGTLACSEGTVKVHLSRARATLRRELEARGASST